MQMQSHGRQQSSSLPRRAAVAARGRFVMPVSGGHTPRHMLRALADEAVPWESVHVAQVDEQAWVMAEAQQQQNWGPISRKE